MHGASHRPFFLAGFAHCEHWLYQAPGPTVCYFVFVPLLLIMALYLLHIKRLCSLREQVLQGENPQLGKPDALFTSVVTAAKCISLHAASAVTNC